jgi:serine phosphatase RsbU (regulator of sigma subunit)/ligand-binding sensor domain-containing protein
MLLLLFCFAHIHGSDSSGSFIHNYPPYQYRAGQQNWAIAQDNRGVLYFGNNDGLLEYDGVNWNLIQLPGVKAVAIDSLGRIYVGLENDMGYLEPDRTGNLKYYSLKSKIPEIYQEHSTVLHLCIFGRKIIFQTSDKLFIYENDRINVLSSGPGFQSMFIVYNHLYVREREKGLFSLENDSLLYIRGSQLFASERINSMLPYRNNEIMIITRINGIFVYSQLNGGTFYKPDQFAEADEFILRNQADCAASLSNGDFAVGTVTGGIIVLNSQGKIKSRYSKSNGLQDNTIFSLYSDHNNQLWAALDKGISLVETNLPFRNFTEQNNLNGTPACLKFFNGGFYVGTSQYLHLQNRSGNFEIIGGTGGQNFCLLEASGSLLLAKSPGIVEIRNMKAFPVAGTLERTFLTLMAFKRQNDYVLAGAYDGIYLLERKNSSWIIRHNIKGFDKTIISLKEDTKGNIWISTSSDLFKVKINQALDSVISYKLYTKEQGLPSDYAFPVELNSGELVFSTLKGIYRFLDDKNRFELHPDFTMLKGKVMPFVQMANGDIWYNESLENGNYEKGVLKLKKGKYIQFKTPFLKFADISCSESPYNICSAPDSTVFFGTTSGLLQFDPSVKVDIDRHFQTLIRKVFSKDSLLFGGSKSGSVDFKKNSAKSVPHSQNDMVFHFAASFYEEPEKNLYSYRLIGSVSAWSPWVNDHKKEYTNLPGGKYIFEVKSKNLYQTIGSTASYSFTVLSPWYRTWLAYVLYITMATLLIWMIVKLNIRRLVKQKEQLEQIVAERTTEIVAQKKQIEAVHAEITASINYAKYIQSSVFPKTDELESCLGDHFIIHKPAEIVSGDFYWVAQKDNRIIVAAADCTGHGVPGAFMSMLGITLLNEIVNRENVTDPGVILGRLRDEITASLKQKGERGEQKDGMDISLCTIDRATMKLKFAGAINPLYMIRSSADENGGIIHVSSEGRGKLAEIKGDRMPIGISDEMEDFTVHTIEIQKDDTFYLFTDGFPDQFGGPGRKKFSYKRFRELLISTHIKPMSNQKSLVENALVDWMGETNQTDDILVIGFRIN